MDDIKDSRWIGPVGVALLVIVGFLILMFARPTSSTPPTTGGTATSTLTAIYSNDQYGVTFEYPETYQLTENDAASGERRMHLVMLTRKADLPPPQDGEGPPTIEFAFYQNNLDRLTPLQWVQNDSRSNWKLGDGMIATTTVAGTEAVVYRWSGLYEGATLAFAHKGNIIAATVNYLTPEDENIRVFQDILTSLKLR